MEDYLNRELFYTDHSLQDPEFGCIMMDWETEIMRESAKVVCSKGGDVLNIGFGMGIVDGFIQEYPLKTHTIVECHPVVLKRMKSEGWFDKKNVNIISDRWQNRLQELESQKFDGVYYDTTPVDSYDEFIKICQLVHRLLRPGGVFSFLNSQYYYPPTKSIEPKIYKILQHNFDMDSSRVVIDYDKYDLDRLYNYWNNKKTKNWIPICIRK